MSSILLQLTSSIIEPYADIQHLKDYLMWVKKYGFVVAYARLEERLGEARRVEIEQYAYKNLYTYHARNGRLLLNPRKVLFI